MRIFLLLLIFIHCSLASVVLTDATIVDTDFTIEYLYDESSTLTIEDVRSRAFEQEIPSQFTLGYREGNGWFKITLENRSQKSDFVLYFTEPFWADFDLYEPVKEGFSKQYNGLLHSLQQRQIKDFSPAFDITINTGEIKTYYVRGQTVNGHIGAFEIYAHDEYYRPSRFGLNTFYLFYSGILFIIVILNVFLLLEMRERIYIYYIGYVASFFVFISMFSGSYLALGLPGWNEGLHTVGTVVLAFMTMFSASYLQLKRYFPRMYKFFKLLTFLFVVMGILISQNVPYVTLIFNLFAFLAFTLFLILAIKILKMGQYTTRYYLIALIIYMPTMGMMALTFDGLISNSDFTRYTFLLGALVEIIVFSFILANRFHSVQADKINIQKQLLEEKQNNEDILKREVERQSKEITQKNALILHQSRHAAMGEMIGMIAHQWRQPLSAITATVGSLQIKMGMDKYDKEFFDQQLEGINSFSQHLSSTIEDFRNFFKQDKEKNVFNVEEAINSSLSLSESLYKNKNIVIETDLDSSVEIKSYKNELVQVFINILKNAHDALIENAVENPKVIIRMSEDSNNRVTITIEDNAGGISEENSLKIFEPYFSTKSKNGTGLGLYMSKSIVEEHCGGKLLFHNTDVGACFTIILDNKDEAE